MGAKWEKKYKWRKKRATGRVPPILSVPLAVVTQTVPEQTQGGLSTSEGNLKQGTNTFSATLGQHTLPHCILIFNVG